jgi:hypothetical protein
MKFIQWAPPGDKDPTKTLEDEWELEVVSHAFFLCPMGSRVILSLFYYLCLLCIFSHFSKL